MTNRDNKFYSFKDIQQFLDYAYFLRKEFPFNRKDFENIKCSWGTLVIPKNGIEQTVQNKISDIDEQLIEEIDMLYQLPYEYKGKIGIISKNISLNFRYDKQWKYGDINKNIAECCYFILKNAKRLNDFYILDDDTELSTFMANYVACNQWGLGGECVSHSVSENLSCIKELITEVEK